MQIVKMRVRCERCSQMVLVPIWADVRKFVARFGIRFLEGGPCAACQQEEERRKYRSRSFDDFDVYTDHSLDHPDIEAWDAQYWAWKALYAIPFEQRGTEAWCQWAGLSFPF
jgi:hypothetical protein